MHLSRSLASRIATTKQIVVPFEQDLMDQTVRCGWARLTFEADQTAISEDAGSMRDHVHVHVEAGGGVEVTLVDQPLPSDVARDPRTADWRCTVLG